MSNKTLAEKLRWLRTEQGKRQTEVAKGLGISTPAWHKIENGMTEVNLTRIKQLAEYFRVDVASLLLEDEPGTYFGNERITELEEEVREYQAKVIELQSKLLACFEKG